MTTRLQKFLADSGIASRRKAEELIRSGQIKINGQVIREMGIKIDPAKDTVEYQGSIIKPETNLIYYMLNKPRDYTTTCSDPHAVKTVLELLPNTPRVFPIGRLDKQSRGLLILTNDGQLANRLTHPKYEHEKEYHVKASFHNFLDPRPDNIKKSLHKLETGFLLDDKMTAPAKIQHLIIDSNKAILEFDITLKEGRNRQIRRMCDMINLSVLDLKRTRIGKLKLGNLPEGQFRTIQINDII